jgi:hypothetical protein
VDNERRELERANPDNAAWDRKFGWLRGAPKFFTQKKFSCGGPHSTEPDADFPV